MENQTLITALDLLETRKDDVNSTLHFLELSDDHSSAIREDVTQSTAVSAFEDILAIVEEVADLLKTAMNLGGVDGLDAVETAAQN